MILQAMDTEATERCINWLKSGDIRPTRQRIGLAALLVGDGKDRHVSAESLYESASATGLSVSLATVYNALRTFCDAGLMAEVTVDGQKSYFDTRTDQHPHYYWEEQNVLTDAPQDAVKFERMPKTPEGMEIAKVDVVIRLREKS